MSHYNNSSIRIRTYHYHLSFLIRAHRKPNLSLSLFDPSLTSKVSKPYPHSIKLYHTLFTPLSIYSNYFSFYIIIIIIIIIITNSNINILSYHNLFFVLKTNKNIHSLFQHNTNIEQTTTTLPLMENCLHHLTIKGFFFTKPISFSSSSSSSSLNFRCSSNNSNKLKVIKASAGASHCQFSSLNSPLLPQSTVGNFLSGVLQNHRNLFHVAVQEELKLLADDRDAAVSRMILSSDSDQALLHR